MESFVEIMERSGSLTSAAHPGLRRGLNGYHRAGRYHGCAFSEILQPNAESGPNRESAKVNRKGDGWEGRLPRGPNSAACAGAQHGLHTAISLVFERRLVA
jgi:hypothetical protein